MYAFSFPRFSVLQSVTRKPIELSVLKDISILPFSNCTVRSEEAFQRSHERGHTDVSYMLCSAEVFIVENPVARDVYILLPLHNHICQNHFIRLYLCRLNKSYIAHISTAHLALSLLFINS